MYPPEDIADWPGRHLEWAHSQWDVFVASKLGRSAPYTGGERPIFVVDDDQTLVSYTGIVVREAAHNGSPVRVGGVGGVKTHPAARGRGYAAAGLRRAMDFFNEQHPSIDFALLVCDPSLLGYYSEHGWQEFTGDMLTRQSDRTEKFVFNRVMVTSVQSSAPTSGTIDLMGPPW